MASLPRRFRASTSTSTQPTSKAFDILRGLIDSLARDTASSGPSGYPDINKLRKSLQQICQHVAASTSSALRDDFRHARGFESVSAVLRGFSGYYDPHKRSEPEMLSLFALLGDCLSVLSAALKGHSGNRRFFRYRVEGGGWDALDCHLFGKLLAFSLDEDGLDLLCQSIAKALRSESTSGSSQTDEKRPVDEEDEQWDLALARSIESIAPAVREVVSSNTIIRFPEILRAVVSFWKAIPRPQDSSASPSSVLLLETILCAISTSFYNRAAVHSTGVLSQFLHVAFGQDSWLAQPEREKLLAICKLLMFLGVNRPADTQFLLTVPGSEASDFCLEMMAEHAGPPFFQFDLSLNGHSSLELPSLGRTFPPQSTGGYTFTAWIRIESFDPNAHTTIFGVFDASQTCFVLIYLEKDTHNLILQTSVFSNKPSVRFKTAVFQEKQWYHVAVVHRRPKTMTASKASLYIDGDFAEQIRCSYPSAPPLLNGSTESFVSFNSSQNRTNPVQAFLGTPRELSGQTGPGVVSSQWSLASAHLFEDVLTDDYLAVHHGLGPRYQGNFQDSLGGFQTYEASAALGLRNEIVHPGKDENSDILRAVREKASSLLPESKILLSVLPTATFPEHVQYMDTGVLRSLPRASIRNLFHMANQEGSPLAVNCAVSSLSDALFRTHGIASLRGTPIIVVPSHLDEHLWRLAGFTPLALKLLERASTVEETVRALEIVFHCIRRSWRNSEAMERDNGYGILGMILRFKIGYGNLAAGDVPVSRLLISAEERDSLTLRVLSLVLDFVGYNHVDPIESFIVNPLAYRILLIDLDIWRRSAPRTQELFYRQFVTFAVNSKHHDFNSRRLIRMRIVKRLLDAMKGEGISDDVLDHFMNAFEALVKSNLSQEVLRSMSLFITYAFHTPPPSTSRTPRPLSAISRSSTPGLGKRGPGDVSRTHSPSVGSKMLSKKLLGKRVLSMYSGILCEKGNINNVKKFARTVTNKWLLYLLADDDATVVLHGCKILSRLLVVQGSSYASKFSGKSGGFTIVASRLKRFWDIPTIWPICFSILFGFDVADIDFDRNFDVDELFGMFGKRKVVYPDALIVITSLLQHGLKEVMRHQEDPDSPAKLDPPTAAPNAALKPDVDYRALSMALDRALESRLAFSKNHERVASRVGVLGTTVRFLQVLQARSQEFRDFTLGSEWVRMLLLALYPVIVSTDAVTPDVELNSRDSALTFDGSDVIIRPIGGGPAAAPIVRTSTVDIAPSPQATPPKGTPLRRASSFVLLTAQTVARADDLWPAPAPQLKLQQSHGGVLSEEMLDLLLGVFVDQVFTRKDFAGFGLFSKVPPGFQEHQAYLESYILKRVITKVSGKIQGNENITCEPRILTNLSRLCLHISEAIFEGWFIDGAEVMIDFSGMLIEMLQRPEISKLKSVRLCSQAVSMVRSCFLRIILLKLSDLDNPRIAEKEAKDFMNKLAYWQMPILECFSLEDDYLKLFWYQLYTKLIDDKPSIRIAAANFLRIVLVQKPEESITTIRSCMASDQRKLSREFQKLTEVDDETFVIWVDQHRPSLDGLFFGSMAKTWEDFVSTENQRTCETARSRLWKRRERLKAWHSEFVSAEKALLNHEVGNSAWMKSIYNTEYFKYQRLLQDQQDDLSFLTAAYSKMERDLRRPGAVFSEPAPPKWKLDRTEGRNRMRLRLLPDSAGADVKYQPKRKAGEARSRATSSGPSDTPPSLSRFSGNDDASTLNPEPALASDQSESGCAPEDDFELVDDPNDPNEGDENYEDKNRKVMRRLEHGDHVQAAHNMSRITGLEACEGLLIVGKDALYIMDNVFQCASGDIVNVWEAPADERDPFTMVVTGAKTLERRQNSATRDQECRHWKWQDVISVSKRRFLFRDVAIEIFFTDGRSYLLTTINPAIRDQLFAKMLSKASHTSAPNALPNPEDAWRLEALKSFDDSPQGFGAGLGTRLGTFFNATPWNPVMKRWQRGEMSNFHYLMMVNTMAGRTFNDLTQYPVFPWVLADYTSEDLDLEDPATFRDLSKPMGAQTDGRVAGFVETYNALQEIGQTPFHYGTHYSSAMIVSSYLIRLPPFVQSYLLVQGDSFDHADRLFQSIGDAWTSASRKNKTDVRELIPEFFCLPEFLTNINGYDFGHRQSNGAKVDNVALPPWAKGDPKIFIAKHREALESRYVSENLHHWIDLVFGHKQRGEAAVENVNVFHHLSYAGASDLDRITDANERAITAGVIHNFGQTPHQVFARPHAAREHVRCPIKRLDTGVFSLSCLDHPLLESHDRVSSLVYATKLDRLLCAPPLRLIFPPYDKFLDWGYADSSLRFFFSDNHKPAGLFENLHTGQISCACFADSKTLITAGEDCVVSVYTVHTAPGKQVDLMPRSSVFGHKTPVTAIAVSKAFSTFVTASSDGQAFLWDLNQLSFIRKLPLVRQVECARINDVSGEIMLCSGPNVLLYTLNGTLMLDQNVCAEPDDYVHSCAFYEGASNEWLENYLVFTGHSKGRVNIWRRSVLGGKWTLELLRRLDHVDCKSDKRDNTEAGITCITTMPTCLYTGDDDGRVYEWNFGRADR
ncbi:beige/BEACH domain-containing protein [Hirsutella rhossiliensis]|uniref:Beige protein homolog 1 n=1 Tax=Hirsutella rhossiliensis TaxID=111463 RepID=A0A9P8MTJ2_9HYPO|nr:beige/BEACH domain-containing protein [Hirsutella rhossiliensis]KAH0961763.1 beige/BEACH domain-containing protein [Hirsutella rhossiliensis]